LAPFTLVFKLEIYSKVTADEFVTAVKSCHPVAVKVCSLGRHLWVHRYHNRSPFTIWTCIIDATICVYWATLISGIARFFHQRPCHAGVLAILQQHGTVVREWVTTTDANLQCTENINFIQQKRTIS